MKIERVDVCVICFGALQDALNELSNIGANTMHLTFQQPCDDLIDTGLCDAGDSWAHAAASRVLLTFQGANRHARIFKSPNLAEGTAEYLVTSDGIRGRRLPKRPRSDEGTN